MKEPTTDAELTDWNDQEDRRVTELVRRHGCFIQDVAGEGRQPPIAYTVGLFGLSHPELIVFGLDNESAGGTLNWFFGRIRAGADLTPGEIVEPPGSGVRFLVEDFPDPGAALYAANRHYQRPREVSVPAYQLTWDADGAFPWEPGYPCPGWLQPRPGFFVE
ncbi:MAG TPA: DUF4262 domain-containing protein [Propionicimonas sp.]|nr:DUF4262 domain-containing protein [Propionicimonas sp.]